MKKLLLTGVLSALLLSSCNNDHYSQADFPSVKKIDTHIHINTESSAYADQAKADNFLLLNISVDVPDYPDVLEQQRLCFSCTNESRCCSNTSG